MDFDYFIDCHCHLFTIADIPIYKPLEVAVGNADNLGTYSLLGFSIFARPFIRPEKKLHDYWTYITFFESEPDQNVARLTGEILAGLDLTRSSFGIGAKEKVITPLVMDFDSGASVIKLRAQADRLRSAAKNNTSKVKILPFLGIHPGRPDVETLLADYQVQSVAKRGGYSKTGTGDFIGIKLYPPLGFDPYPDNDPSLKASYLTFYDKLADMEIPVTVHCQKGSFELTRQTELYTNPLNWELVLQEMRPEQANKLRINFAHFGGEDGVKNAVWFERKDGNQLGFLENEFKKITPDGWTYSIIRMIKKYDNAYADISAFDFSDEQALASFHWLLDQDRKGQLKDLGPHKLEDKLLWGSDYPMILGGDTLNYAMLLLKFMGAFHLTGRKRAAYPYPEPDQAFTREYFLKKICCDNPQKFLF